MNIFVLSKEPIMAAKAMCDQHVVKMILESTQLLCGALPNNSFAGQYKQTHMNHPCSVWTRTNDINYSWLYYHAISLCNEYTKRFDKIHKSHLIVLECAKQKKIIDDFEEEHIDFVMAMPDEIKSDDVVQSYRKYYNTKAFEWWSKERPMRWTNALPHSWFHGPKVIIEK